ncbi:MAG: hypothetical protein S4CHLAM45_03780 [Chlamydiales bacterium]|nr:hypothetical protein [Chlamydiales bacterium]MCH9619232.1 hypothetical protein [Chlamydiales bacterium]MCH9622494.1 hypothetical protein [Chlamydiales bacterium]
MKKLLFILCCLPSLLTAGEEKLNVNLDKSWTLIQDSDANEERVFKIWQKDDERMVIVAYPWNAEKKETIQQGIKQYREQVGEFGFTIHEQSEDEALIEWEIPHKVKVLTKFIYTPHASCIVAHSYMGEQTEKVAMDEWIAFFQENISLETIR